MRVCGLFCADEGPGSCTHIRAGFLLFRVLKMGSDARFDEIRSHFFKFSGGS